MPFARYGSAITASTPAFINRAARLPCAVQIIEFHRSNPRPCLADTFVYGPCRLLRKEGALTNLSSRQDRSQVKTAAKPLSPSMQGSAESVIHQSATCLGRHPKNIVVLHVSFRTWHIHGPIPYPKPLEQAFHLIEFL